MSHRFVFLADTQLGCFATFSGFDDATVAAYAERDLRVERVPAVAGFEWDAARYREAVVAINTVRPAFVVIGGDLIDDPNSEDQTEAFLAITATIDHDIPVHWVPGNHDIAPDFTTPTAESMAAYRDVFGPDLISFVVESTLYLGLNTTVIDRPELVPDELDRQLEWLEHELSDAPGRGVETVVVLGHHPFFTETPDEPDSYWNLPLERRRPLLDRLVAAGASIGFAGHWHRNALAAGAGFTQVVSGPVGYPLGDDPSGYRVVDVGPDGVVHAYHPLG